MVQQRKAVEKDEWVRSESSLGEFRFITQGVPVLDVQNTLTRIVRDEEWCPEWSATAEMHEKLAREAERQGHNFSAGEGYNRAALCYHFGKMRWIKVLEKEDHYHDAHRKSIAAFRRGIQYLDPTAQRVEIPYDGIIMPAYLRRPQGAVRPPVVILVPGYDSVKEEFFNWGNVFLNRGMAVLSPDGPGQGETRNVMPLRHDYEGAGSAMIDFLQSRDDVDHSSIGLVGVSRGGYYAPRIAAFDHRVKAVIANGGSYRTTLPPNQAGPWAMFVNWTTTVEETIENMNRLSLAGAIGNIRCPFLVVAAKMDAQAAYSGTEEMAIEAKAAGVAVTYVLFEEGSHVGFNIPYRYQPLNGDWMWDQLCRS